MLARIILLATLLAATTAAANDRRAVLENEAGGLIVLTFVPTEHCPEGFGAYTTNPRGKTIRGCWIADEVMVHIEWTAAPGEVRSYNINDFRMVGDE